MVSDTESESVLTALHAAAQASKKEVASPSSGRDAAEDLEAKADDSAENSFRDMRAHSVPVYAMRQKDQDLESDACSGGRERMGGIGEKVLTRSNTHEPAGNKSRAAECIKTRITPTVKQLRAHEKRFAKMMRDIARQSTICLDYRVEVNTSQISEAQAATYFAEQEDLSDLTEDEEAEDADRRVPALTICILIVGTRGDVQPFIAIGKRLLADGHRVRLATHANFRNFVMDQGLEFYPLGGDPKILAEYMVKNKGFLPSRPSEVTVQRKQLKAIINSTWPACTEADVEGNGVPFIADAIIANPPTMGTNQPVLWPLGRLSYSVVDNMIWIGMRDIVNDFRKKKLKLAPITYLKRRRKQVVPTAYIWSPSLVPKPEDWGRHVDVVGFCFLSLGGNYSPPQDLLDFFKAGKPPIYIGFGSLPVPYPNKMTSIIVKAIEHTGQRGIIQKGWGGLGILEKPNPSIYTLGNCPHDWLFPQCAAVVHHGGAGTTAAGLKAGCPTTVVPFFGDQPFWGESCHKQGVGPDPITLNHFDFDHLVKAIEAMLKPEAKEAAKHMAKQFQLEDGVAGAVGAFYRNLPKGIRPGAHSLTWMKKKDWTFGLTKCMSGTPTDD